MPKFVLIQDGFRRRPWEISILNLIQTRFPTTGHKSERESEKEKERSRGSHLGGWRGMNMTKCPDLGTFPFKPVGLGEGY